MPSTPEPIDTRPVKPVTLTTLHNSLLTSDMWKSLPTFQRMLCPGSRLMLYLMVLHLWLTSRPWQMHRRQMRTLYTCSHCPLQLHYSWNQCLCQSQSLPSCVTLPLELLVLLFPRTFTVLFLLPYITSLIPASEPHSASSRPALSGQASRLTHVSGLVAASSVKSQRSSITRSHLSLHLPHPVLGLITSMLILLVLCHALKASATFSHASTASPVGLKLSPLWTSRPRQLLMHLWVGGSPGLVFPLPLPPTEDVNLSLPCGNS